MYNRKPFNETGIEWWRDVQTGSGVDYNKVESPKSKV